MLKPTLILVGSLFYSILTVGASRAADHELLLDEGFEGDLSMWSLDNADSIEIVADSGAIGLEARPGGGWNRRSSRTSAGKCSYGRPCSYPFG